MQTPKGATHAAFAVLLLTLFCGCTSWRDYFRNGCKVGPDYVTPPAPVARDWIDANDASIRRSEQEVCQWWKVFNDPALDSLICTAYRQNLTLRQAGFRILQARAQLNIDQGNLFPQTQNATGSYNRIARSKRTAGAALGGGPQFFDQWDFGF